MIIQNKKFKMIKKNKFKNRREFINIINIKFDFMNKKMINKYKINN